jgi:acetyl-CoA acyltransferase 1
MAQLAAGFPSSSCLSTTNRQCSSGLQAVANIANAIASGNITVGIGAGVESMSTHPMKDIPMPDVNWEEMKKSPESMECTIPMGVTSENVAKAYGLSRPKLDEYSVESHRRAAAAQASGKFSAEIVPVGKVDQDDGIRATTSLEILSKLKPVFDENGVTTAGNSSQTTDGAAAILLMTRAEAQRRHLNIMGVWRGFVVKGVPPRIMGIGPAVAIPAVLDQLSLRKEDIGVYEINEAFASQVTWCMDYLDLDHAKVNPNGGAISLGHPLGCTGARQIVTLLHELHRTKQRYGLVSMCIGTGMGAAAVIEVEPQSGL